MALELDDTAALPSRTATLAAPTQKPTSGTKLASGLRLGHFRIDKELGAGGMGEVYLATDLALDRPVAIKVLPAGTTTGVARDRLIREARAQARVQHPNVAHIYFIGEDAGRLYFAMEYVTGQTLAARLAAGPLPVEDALDVIRGAVQGLREAQRSGFTHRDVKPSNLMVDAHGVVKVLDFGLAASNPSDLADGATETGPVPQTSFAGTPLYMAPEQARGDAIDLRADIYALGATLYHLVSGRPPFQADSVVELASMHATAARPPLPRGANPRTSIAAIDALVGRMMAPQPGDRFASYDELLRALDLVSVQRTKPAGFWVRAITTMIDLALAATVLTLIRMLLRASVDFGMFLMPLGIATTMLALLRWGTTPGKALFELEVVSIDTGGRPAWTQTLVRQLVLGGPLAMSSILSHLFGHPSQVSTTSEGTEITLFGGDLWGLVAIATIVLPIAALAYAAIRVPGKRSPWDRASRTQVRYRVTRREAAALLPS